MNKYLVEFTGTFFLVFTIGAAAIYGDAGLMAPVAIGAVLIGVIYAGGHISGAHYNPAVSIAMILRGVISIQDATIYITVQVVAAVVASLLAMQLYPTSSVDVILPNVQAFLLVEFLFTFVLVYVILNVATAKATAGNAYFGIAIGFTVMAGAFAVGGISGDAFQPGRSHCVKRDGCRRLDKCLDLSGSDHPGRHRGCASSSNPPIRTVSTARRQQTNDL